jgi:electron transport complex protein RnfG
MYRFALAGAISLVAAATGAMVLITVEEALELAFPGVATTRETLFLSDDQRSRAEKESGSEISSALATRYVAKGDGGAVLGWAYLDTHRVRTLPETLMVVLGTGGAVQRVEVVTFREPIEYMPREGWYGQYRGQELDDDLALKRDIRPVTGATLTARATTEAVRRVLAIHAVVEQEETK